MTRDHRLHSESAKEGEADRVNADVGCVFKRTVEEVAE